MRSRRSFPSILISFQIGQTLTTEFQIQTIKNMAGRFCQRDGGIMTAMVAVVVSDVGMNTLFKAASSKGMSSYVFLVYSYGIGALLLLPSPFLTHRSLSLSLYLHRLFFNL